MKRRPKTFVELKAEWYGKLKKEGFQDIENADESLKVYTTLELIKPVGHGEQAPLKDSTAEAADRTYRNALTEYYYLAEQFAENHTWVGYRGRMERRVWELHAEGIPERTIVGELARKYPKLTRRQVQGIIGRLRVIMLGGL